MKEFTPTKDQENALKEFGRFLGEPKEKFMVLQGAAGCGKSTMIPLFAKAAKAFHGMRALLLKGKERNPQLYLTATTNPAVAVLEDLTSMAATTIYTHLRLGPRINFKTGKTTFHPKKDAEVHENELIIIDEGSMIDDHILKVIDKQTKKCKILIIGDQYQLAAVGEVTSVMETMNCRKACMNQIMRNSGIIMETGAQFRDSVETSIFKAIPEGHEEMLHVDGPTFQKMIDKAYTDSLYGVKSAKVLAWTNSRVLQYTQHIRQVKGLPKDFMVGETVQTNKPIITSGRFHKCTDAIVQITGIGKQYTDDEYGIRGRQIELDQRYSAFLPDNQIEVKKLLQALAKRKSWVQHYAIKDGWLDLRLPYASTVHKAQGSSYGTTFIDLADIGKCSVPTDVARMLYVSISRATDQVVLYGKLPPWYAGMFTEPITAKLIGKTKQEISAGVYKP